MTSTEVLSPASFDPAVWYTTNAGSYAATWNGVVVDSLGEFAAGCDPDGVVVDPACGTGRDVAAWRSLGFTVFGSDIAPGQVANAAALCGDGIVTASFFDLPYPSGFAASIWAHAAVVHLDPLSAVVALEEFARVARLGARLFVNAKVADGSVDPATGCDAAGRWFHLWDLDELTGVVARAGWSPVCSVEVPDPSRATVRWAQVTAELPF